MKKYNQKYFLFSFILITVSSFNTAWANTVNNSKFHTNQIIIKFKDNVDRKIATANLQPLNYRAGLNLRYKRATTAKSDVFYLPRNMHLDEVNKIAQQLMENDDIAYAEPDARRFPLFTPDDPNLTNQWYLTEATGGINADDAWDISTGTGIVIAVLDSGVTGHSQLGGQLQDGFDFISDITTANDGDAREDDEADPGDNVVADECGPDDPDSNQDSSWHGTIIAGQLVAITNDTTSIAGLAHNATVLPIRVLGKCGGFISDITDAMRWAVGTAITGVRANATPADVVNLSLGSTSSCSATEQSAINDVIAAGVTVIVAAGNEGTLANTSAPGNCSNTITVAATTRGGAETSYTNIGDVVDISAPGGSAANGIFSISDSGTTSPAGDTTDSVIGTSFATPLVTGTVALMLALDNTLTPTEIYGTLLATARTFPTGTVDGFGDCTTSRCGAGIVDANAAVIAVNTAAVTDTSFPTKESAKIDNDDDEDDSPTSTGGGSGSFDLLLIFSLLLLTIRNITRR